MVPHLDGQKANGPSAKGGQRPGDAFAPTDAVEAMVLSVPTSVAVPRGLRIPEGRQVAMGTTYGVDRRFDGLRAGSDHSLIDQDS